MKLLGFPHLSSQPWSCGSLSTYIPLVAFLVLLQDKDPEMNGAIQSSQSPPLQDQQTGNLYPVRSLGSSLPCTLT